MLRARTAWPGVILARYLYIVLGEIASLFRSFTGFSLSVEAPTCSQDTRVSGTLSSQESEQKVAKCIAFDCSRPSGPSVKRKMTTDELEFFGTHFL